MAGGHVFPAPFVVSPIGPHTHTLIFLHGRGDTGPSFGSGLYIATGSSGFSLPSLYPGLKFIFPTTAKRYSSSFRCSMTEWFDTASLTFPEEQGHMQKEGLRDAVEHIEGLISDEVELGIPEHNIIIGGISQGCATALHVLLSHKARLGGFVGMSGWLPFASNIRQICRLSSGAGLRVRDGRGSTSDGEQDESEDEPEDAGGEQNNMDPSDGHHPSPRKKKRYPIPLPENQTEALVFARDNLSLPPGLAKGDHSLVVLKTPVFLGHGDEDYTVDYKLGRNIYSTLKHGLGMDVTWKRYKMFGHWYKVSHPFLFPSPKRVATHYLC
ncbi:Alpha/Beta hydrolase protein [Trichophaea hybrida]|nr:Alpha/Beta hydrolase protein [Trichophaea hybrida]